MTRMHVCLQLLPDKSSIPEIIKTVTLDVNMSLSETHGFESTLAGVTPVTYDGLTELTEFLDYWKDKTTGRGRHEVFVGTLQQIFPLDNQQVSNFCNA